MDIENWTKESRHEILHIKYRLYTRYSMIQMNTDIDIDIDRRDTDTSTNLDIDQNTDRSKRTEICNKLEKHRIEWKQMGCNRKSSNRISDKMMKVMKSNTKERDVVQYSV